MSGDSGLSEPKQLTEAERSLVEWIVEHSDPQYSAYKDQIPHLSVVGRCGFGCPTVTFALRGLRPTRIGGSPISDFQAEVNGMHVGVMLFAVDGQITSLEVYSFAGHEQPFGLPKIESLRAIDF